MKKIFILSLALVLLTGCTVDSIDNTSSNNSKEEKLIETGEFAGGYNVKNYNNYTSYIYCTQTPVCEKCKSWNSVSEEELKVAMSITCTNLSTAANSQGHYHYCVTWQNRG